MLLINLLAAGAAAAMLAPFALRALRATGSTRTNWRGLELPVPAGAVAAVAAVLAAGVLALVDQIGGSHLLYRAPEGWTSYVPLSEEDWTAYAPLDLYSVAYTIRSSAVPALVVGLGAAALGLLADALRAAPGSRWSLAAAAATGAPALVVLVAPEIPAGEVILAAAVVSLAAVAFVALDERPGRAWKAFVVLGAGLLIASWDLEPLRGIGLFAGPLLVLGVYDLRERALLGTAGSALLGAMAGLWIVAVTGPTGQLVAACVLAAVVLLAQLFPLSAAIEKVPPLRVLDWLGRRDPDA